MTYQYRCPLCLARLGSGHKLIAFKSTDATSSRKWEKLRVDCAKPEFVKEILDFGGDDCFTSGDDEAAIFVSHVQCKANHPFWDEASGQIIIPGKADDGRSLPATFQCPVTTMMLQKELRHWLIGMLRKTLNYSSKYHAMWFPFPLLLATAAADGSDSRRPYGCLVEMDSTPGVGKTIMTLQLLNHMVYQNDYALDVTDYFYPKSTFIQELYFRCIWESRPAARPLPTSPTPGDLRVLFIKPVSPATLPSVHHNGSSGGGRLRRFSRWFKKDGGYFIRHLFGIGLKDEEIVFDLDQMLTAKRKTFWNPVLFYDTAGELREKAAPILGAVRQITNKLAICLDARDIFDLYNKFDEPKPVAERNASIKYACERINEFLQRPHRRKNICLMVTQLDLVEFEPEEREEVTRVAEDASVNDGVAREMLIKWLRDNTDMNKEKLIDCLRQESSVIERVFFTWTEDLPKMQGIRYSPIKNFTPQSGKPGDKISIHANAGFDFNDAKKIIFGNKSGQFEIKSDKLIEAAVPDGATSGFIGIVLDGKNASTGASYIDEATSETIFEVQPGKATDAGKPRSYGLVKFLAWCLDKSVEEIARPRVR